MSNLNAGGTKALMARLLKPLIAVVALALVFEEGCGTRSKPSCTA